MTVLLTIPVLAASLVMSVLAMVYAVECVLGSLPDRRGKPADPHRRALTILIPAHNEEAGIAATVHSIRAQMRDGDQLLVIADNCNDNTAAAAREAGAAVLQRFDDARRSKGFALDFGIQHLRQSPPDYVVLIDADCSLEPGALDSLAETAAASGGPVQACYLMSAPEGAPIDLSIAEFAFLIKNRVRPLGLARLGLPCQLTGSGMAFPWAVLEKADLAHGNIVEDMKLGLDLAAQGHPPQFCADAVVRSQFPHSSTGIATQRQRWEQGHIAMMRAKIAALASPQVWRDPASLALIVDVLVPPLTLLAAILLAMLGLAAGLALAGLSAWPLAISLFNIALLGIGTGTAWLGAGAAVLPARLLLRLPLYMGRKLRLYPRAVFGRGDGTWTRTDRDKSP